MIQNDINLLTKRTKVKVQVFLEYAKSEWFDIFIFESKRTKERQKELYGYGRNMEALRMAWVDKKYAKPLDRERTRTLNSKHLIGEAVDIVFDANVDPKFTQPSWNGNYKRLIQIGERCGLYNLSPREVCHFEDDGKSIKTVMEKNSKAWHTVDDKGKIVLSSINDLFKLYNV